MRPMNNLTTGAGRMLSRRSVTLPAASSVTIPAASSSRPSTDPLKVAAAMEGLKVKSFNGEIEMRKADHQLQQALYLTVWQKTDAKYPYSPEKTGMTLVPVKEFPSYISSTPTSCQMKRPANG